VTHLKDASVVYADVAIDTPAATHGRSIYTYLVPERLQDRVRPGHLVWIPLRNEIEPGLVVRLHFDPPDVELKSILSLVRPQIRLDDQQLAIARWISRETVTSIYASASPFFPPGVRHGTVDRYELVDPEVDLDPLGKSEREIVGLLLERGPLSGKQISRLTGRSSAAGLRRLAEAGFVERVLEIVESLPAARMERFVRLLQPDMQAVERAERQRAVLDAMIRRQRFLRDKGDLFPWNDLLHQTGATVQVIRAMERKGLVEVLEMPPNAHQRVAKPTPAPVLTAEQAAAWSGIEERIRNRDSIPIMLFGVTGSGKTEIYLRMAGRCLREGRSAIVLLPEISLATQILRRFDERFPGQVAVLHSAQSDPERYAQWQAVAAGEKSIVVGPRSALFAPVRNLGCIVIDEEQDTAYKQDADPRYHARSLAEFIAAQREAAIVLGSATPAVETMHRAAAGAIGRVDLPERVAFASGGVDTVQDRQAGSLPSVTIVDMRAEARLTGATLIAHRLIDAIDHSLGRREQAIVLLNRRGMSTVVMCRTCGASVDCQLCDIPMVYHRDQERLICHRCDSRLMPPRECPACGGPLDYFGAGTQRIEQELRHRFSEANVLRLDRDSIRKLGGYEKALKQIEQGEVDIVVGTQLVAKGLDFPHITTVGVIQADSLLHLPDFRSAERTYQLIAQVAGRAGRRAAHGDVFVQTYTPDHYAVAAAARHDYGYFYEQEIAFRQRYRYPPFSRLGRFVFRASSEQACRNEAETLAVALAQHAHTRGVSADLIGPAPAFAARIRGAYQWQIVLRAPAGDFDKLLDDLPARPGWIVDIDPMSML
jgi:primosomal protein N' (replication factor Y) (superfamily II helicase)